MTDEKLQEQIDALEEEIAELRATPWPGAEEKPPPVDPDSNPWES